ncbi:MAG TPA: penicillin-binding protein activator [Steroidobacteraceae bacterium]|nr:penicillin-binding protein activator [Steroidobacteraceae bacterium]
MLHVSLRRGQASLRATLLALLLCAALPAVPVQAQATEEVARQAESLAAAGRHLEAAARYEQAARRGFLSWDARYALLAAREYAAAGEVDEAERMLGRARSRVRSDEERALLALVEGGLALDRGDARRAVAEARVAPMSVSNDLAAAVLDLRGRAELASGQHLAGVRTFEARAALLDDPSARAENDRRLFDQLVLYPPPASPPTVPGMSERERGWLELPGVVANAGASTPQAATRVRDWLLRHPAHPGTAFLPRAGGAVLTVPMGADASIALLLPLSGKQAAAGLAIRDGFAAGWFASGSQDMRTRVQLYDTSAGAAAAYQRAIADGARVVVGPLLKEDVVAVVNSQPAGLPVPTLALNSAVPDDALAPAFLYQFALDPEQEARAVARRIADDGLARGIALFPESAWGQRVHAAFVDELQRLGSVTLTSAQFYTTGARDFSDPLRAALGRFGGAGDRSADRSKPRPARNPAAEQAAGPQFAFVAATSSTARAIRPQLRFQMTYELPVYSTSDAWEPSVRSVPDLEGLVFPEMPWLLYGGQGAPELWDAVHADWSSRARGRLRLFAFGYDAFRLAQQLGSGLGVGGLVGLTGTLEIQRGDGHVRRDLQFARVEGGKPRPAPPGAVAFPATPPPNAAGTDD